MTKSLSFTVEQEDLAQSLSSNSFQRYSIRVRLVQSSQVLCSFLSLWALLWLLVCNHVGTGRGYLQTVFDKLGELCKLNCAKCFGMLKHWHCFTEPNSWKTSTHCKSLSTRLYIWHNAVRKVTFYWKLKLHLSPLETCFTSHLTLRIAFGDGLNSDDWPWKYFPWSSFALTIFELIWIAIWSLDIFSKWSCRKCN